MIMKRIFSFSGSQVFLLGFLLIISSSCNTEVESKSLPVLTTVEISKITQNTATSGGIITSEGGLKVTARGVCWSLNPNPTINDSITKDSVGIGEFTSNISTLIANMTYYIRAYATNSKGTAYGNQVSFKTASPIILGTETPTTITMNSAISGGNISTDDGLTITARGVCWSTHKQPTINDNKTIDGVGIGTFSSKMTGLIRNTTYYVRAYAINSSGTSYGNIQSFITSIWDGDTISDIDGNVYHTVIIGTQVWLVENLKTTRYSNGDLIGTTSDDINNDIDPKYQWPCNLEEQNVSTYGRYYTWYAVNDKRNICPEGWHVPSNEEWLILFNYISNKYSFQKGENMANVMSSKSNWILHCDNVSNSTGFTALPGGYRETWNASPYFGLIGYWWSSTARTDDTAFFSVMWTCDFGPSCYTVFKNKNFGYCVRCVLN